MYSRVWRVCVVTGVTVGLLRLWLLHPVATGLALPMVAAYALLLVRVWHWTFTSDSPEASAPPSTRSVLRGTLVVVGVVGLMHLEFLLGTTAVVVGFLSSPWLLGRWFTDGRRIAVAAPAAGTEVEVRSHLDVVLAELDDSELCRRWRQSYVDLETTPPDRRWRVVELRAAYLDEMTRRHPRAVEAWWANGGHAWASPESYFNDSP